MASKMLKEQLSKPYKTRVVTSFASSTLRAKHVTSSQMLELTMFIVFVFYDNSKVYSYLHRSYITTQQAMNFITAPS